MKSFSAKSIAAAVISAAFFFVLGRYAAVPGGVASLGVTFDYGILAFVLLAVVSAIWGAAAGVICGGLGAFLVDVSRYGIHGLWWYNYAGVIIFAFLVGMMTRKLTLYDGRLSKKDLIGFNCSQAAAAVVARGALQPLLELLIEREPTKHVFTQGLAQAGFMLVFTALLGTAALFVYSFICTMRNSKKRK